MYSTWVVFFSALCSLYAMSFVTLLSLQLCLFHVLSFYVDISGNCKQINKPCNCLHFIAIILLVSWTKTEHVFFRIPIYISEMVSFLSCWDNYFLSNLYKTSCIVSTDLACNANNRSALQMNRNCLSFFPSIVFLTALS